MNIKKTILLKRITIKTLAFYALKEYNLFQEVMALIGDRLAALRKARQLTQEQCAEELGITQSKYNKWENNRNAPDYETVCNLARFYNTTTDYLLGVDELPTRSGTDIAARTGLSEGAIDTLEYVLNESGDKNNSYTRTVNTLLENRQVIGSIAMYLYYKLKKTDSTVPTEEDESLQLIEAVYQFDEDANNKIDRSFTDAITTGTYKTILLGQVTKALQTLLDEEDKKSRLSPGTN